VPNQLSSPAQQIKTATVKSVVVPRGPYRYETAVLALVVFATVIAYSPVLFNFFAGDDFVHLTWLRHAVHQPELILKNFYSSWLDGTTTKFYRPLISVFMVTDYVVGQGNGIAFHLTNLLFHLSSTLLLFGIVRQVQRQLTNTRDDVVALTAAAIFSLYPLHPEAVSWITGRVDSIVTTFCLGSLWTYFRWRETTKPAWLGLSLVSLVLGLLSKEMAITVPAVIVGFEILAPNLRPARLLKTIPYWLVLAGYFVVRRLALGTFVGGYDDSLLFIANVKEFALNWLHAVRMFLIPINKELLGSHNLLTKTWEALIAVAAVLGVIRFACKPESRRPMLFAIGWLVCSLLPVYKLFAIADDLQGSRLAYLATVPLSMLLAYALCATRRVYLPIAFCSVAAVILFINNMPWRQAGLEANAIRASLQQIYTPETGDPQTLLIGMPDHYKGAYIARNAIWGMTKYPQMRGDIWNCLTLNEFEPVHPFGFLKASLAENKDKVRVFKWDNKAQTFVPLHILSGTPTTTNVPFDNRQLEQKARPELVLTPQNVSCWDTDFVRVDLDLLNDVPTQTGAELLYANDISPEFQLGKRTHAEFIPGQKHQTLTFALRSLPEWSFGNAQPRLKLMLPPKCNAHINSITIIPASELIPQINFNNAGYMGTKGYMHLGKDALTRELSIDASSIANAASTEVEITRANLLFEQQNASKYSTFAREHTAAPLKGTYTLRKTDFTSPGIYELRVWAKDNQNRLLGLSSDHIVLSVDP
jgi:hypothetical protein